MAASNPGARKDPSGICDVGPAVYWLRWWLWLRLREFSLLKVSAAALALLLVLQVPAGVAGASSTATWSRVLVLAAQIGVFVGLAQFLHHLSRRILHPAD